MSGYQLFKYFLSVKNAAIGGDGDNLPWNKFTAVLQSCDSGAFNASAARNFYPHDGETFYRIIFNNFR